MSVLTLIRGDDRILDVTLSSPVSDGARLDFTVKRRISDADDDAVIQKDSEGEGGGITFDEGAGSAEIRIVAADTQDLDVAPHYVWDIQMTGSEGEVTTLASGRLVLRPDVTRGEGS
jgi:hypothetical protein